MDLQSLIPHACVCFQGTKLIFAAVINTNLHHSTYGHSRILIIHVDG